MKDHKEHLEEVAREAAKLYGQDWDRLNTGTRDRWIEAVRNTQRGGGENGMDKIAGQAIDDWYKGQERSANDVAAPVLTEATAVPPPTPKKRGK